MPLSVEEFKALIVGMAEKAGRASGDVQSFVFHNGTEDVKVGETAEVQGYRCLAFQVSGLVSATLRVEATIDGQAWHPLPVDPVATITPPATEGEITEIVSNGIYRVDVRGLSKVRIPVTTYVGGSIAVTGSLQA